MELFVLFQRGSFVLDDDIFKINPSRDNIDPSIHTLTQRSLEEMTEVLNAAKGIKHDRRK